MKKKKVAGTDPGEALLLNENGHNNLRVEQVLLEDISDYIRESDNVYR